MTVRKWLAARAPVPPAPLSDRLLQVLGERADLPATEATSVFISASEALLSDIVSGERFTRDGALDLLVADALMTYAFEHASEHPADQTGMASVAATAASSVAQLAGTNG